MAGRRGLLALVLLAATLHLAGIARSLLPAQDGLKFLRIAHEFQTKPWADVVRASDQHPLYPGLVALAEPVVASIAGPGPNTWRIAAQGVASLAALLLLFPLYGLTRSLFDDRVAWLALLIYIVLPLPAAIGHDTLSDSLAFLAALSALNLGERAIRTDGWHAPLGCGLAAGLGFMARPEVAVVPMAVILTWASTRLPSFAAGTRSVPATRIAALGLSFLVLVGAYALFKGDVSEKLALRIGAGIGSRPPLVRKVKQWLPPGLDDPRWNFAPKEESEEPAAGAAPTVAGRLFLQWAECLCGGFAFLAAWGVVRDRYIRTLCREAGPDPRDFTRRLLAVYLALFSLVLFRHASRMGYLSDRHTLMLVIASIPWAAAGTFVCARGLAVKLHWQPRTARVAGVAAVLGLVAAGVYLQSKPAHQSRWGHWAAGRWLADHAGPADAVLDTRGWAAFVSGRPSYDYWHVRQAFTDSHLAYIVVGTGELSASSKRAETLRAVLAYAATPVAEFPERLDRQGTAAVRVYRYHRPESWEGAPMMTHGSFWQRLVRGHGWTWLAERHRAALPADLGSSVMSLESRDRLHAKQGRTTARVVFHAPTGALSVYLKRHYALPWLSRLGALIHPRGRYSPAAAEWAHLERVRSLGIAVPEVVAAGENIGPWGGLSSFLMVAELTGALPLHEALPELSATSPPAEFATWKRALVREMARIVATLHRAGVFHKDLYLCHFFLEMNDPLSRRPVLSLIDLHRMGEHRAWANRWRWKDLGQLLFSTRGVRGADDRDCLRFWSIYRKALGLRSPRWHLRMIRLKAERYLAHNS